MWILVNKFHGILFKNSNNAKLEEKEIDWYNTLSIISFFVMLLVLSFQSKDRQPYYEMISMVIGIWIGTYISFHKAQESRPLKEIYNEIADTFRTNKIKWIIDVVIATISFGIFISLEFLEGVRRGITGMALGYICSAILYVLYNKRSKKG